MLLFLGACPLDIW